MTTLELLTYVCASLRYLFWFGCSIMRSKKNLESTNSSIYSTFLDIFKTIACFPELLNWLSRNHICIWHTSNCTDHTMYLFLILPEREFRMPFLKQTRINFVTLWFTNANVLNGQMKGKTFMKRASISMTHSWRRRSKFGGWTTSVIKKPDSVVQKEAQDTQ